MATTVNITNLPDSALTSVSIPKEKFYKVGGVDYSLRQLFVGEIEKVTLRAVIAPRTMNVSGGTYDELDVIEVLLKDRELTKKVLETIDSVIPRPILFAIVRPNGETKYAISYKEPSYKDAQKSKVIQYYETSWGVPALTLVGKSVKGIYVGFLQQIDPTFDPTKPIAEAVRDTRQREKIEKQIEAINKKIAAEPSAAKKQEMARQRYKLEGIMNEYNK
jgi:hypothetical protein